MSLLLFVISFSIPPWNSEAGLLNVLLQDSFNLTIEINDNDPSSPLTDRGNITIHVVNAPDSPYFTVATSQVQCGVKEGSAAGTPVLGANCNASIPWTDPDLKFGDFVSIYVVL